MEKSTVYFTDFLSQIIILITQDLDLIFQYPEIFVFFHPEVSNTSVIVKL